MEIPQAAERKHQIRLMLRQRSARTELINHDRDAAGLFCELRSLPDGATDSHKIGSNFLNVWGRDSCSFHLDWRTTRNNALVVACGSQRVHKLHFPAARACSLESRYCSRLVQWAANQVDLLPRLDAKFVRETIVAAPVGLDAFKKFEDNKLVGHGSWNCYSRPNALLTSA
jgi:coproporphyrinogen III oxidase